MIGADGIHSTVRKLAFGPESNHLRYLDFHAAAYTFADPELRKKLGEQFALTDSVDKTVGLYAIPSAGFPYSQPTAHPMPLFQPIPVRSSRQPTPISAGWSLTRSPTAPIPPDLYYDQVCQIEMPRWTTDRVALIGDACQAIQARLTSAN
jgi:2-polyprenyl-6-methoxyphenol hydroxylase-like FAD-dependent oxidoreductase